MSNLAHSQQAMRKKMNNGEPITWTEFKDRWIRPHYNGAIDKFAREILEVSESSLFQWIRAQKEMTDIEKEIILGVVNEKKAYKNDFGRKKLSEILSIKIDNSKSAVQKHTSFSSISIGSEEGKDAIIKLQQKRIQELEELIEHYKSLLKK